MSPACRIASGSVLRVNKLMQEIFRSTNSQSRQPLPKPFARIGVLRWQGQQVVVVRDDVRCGAGNGQLDEMLIVGIARILETDANWIDEFG